MAAVGGVQTIPYGDAGEGLAPKAVASTRVDLRNPKFEWRADPPLYRGLRERCRNGGGMDAGVVAYSHEPRGLNYASNRAGLWPS
jgi:hypothetical protein